VIFQLRVIAFQGEQLCSANAYKEKYNLKERYASIIPQMIPTIISPRILYWEGRYLNAKLINQFPRNISPHIKIPIKRIINNAFHACFPL